MIDIVKPLTPMTHPYGDFEYGTYDQWCSRLELDMYHANMKANGLNILFLSYARMNGWKAAEDLNINSEHLKALRESGRYTCDATDMEFHAVLPLAIVSKTDFKQYFERFNGVPYWQEMAVDFSWNVKEDDSHLRHVGSINRRPELSPVQMCLLGTGVTQWTHPGDGSSSRMPAQVQLSNGDIMIVIVLAWHNK